MINLGKRTLDLKCRDAILIKNLSQPVITENITSVTGILEIMVFDVLPDSLSDLSAKHRGITTQKLGERRGQGVRTKSRSTRCTAGIRHLGLLDGLLDAQIQG